MSVDIFHWHYLTVYGPSAEVRVFADAVVELAVPILGSRTTRSISLKKRQVVPRTDDLAQLDFEFEFWHSSRHGWGTVAGGVAELSWSHRHLTFLLSTFDSGSNDRWHEAFKGGYQLQADDHPRGSEASDEVAHDQWIEIQMCSPVRVLEKAATSLLLSSEPTRLCKQNLPISDNFFAHALTVQGRARLLDEFVREGAGMVRPDPRKPKVLCTSLTFVAGAIGKVARLNYASMEEFAARTKKRAAGDREQNLEKARYSFDATVPNIQVFREVSRLFPTLVFFLSIEDMSDDYGGRHIFCEGANFGVQYTPGDEPENAYLYTHARWVEQEDALRIASQEAWERTHPSNPGDEEVPL